MAKINKKTGKPSVEPSKMEPDNIVDINNIIKAASENIKVVFDYSHHALKPIKKHIIVDYFDDDTEEETTEFHPNMLLLYSNEERECVENLTVMMQNFIEEYKKLESFPDFFDPIKRLSEVNRKLKEENN